MRLQSQEPAFGYLLAAIQTARSESELERFRALARAHYTDALRRELEGAIAARALHLPHLARPFTMDARVYFCIADAIAAAGTAAEFAAMRDIVRETPMHPLERQVLERALRAREDAARLGTPSASSRHA